MKPRSVAGQRYVVLRLGTIGREGHVENTAGGATEDLLLEIDSAAPYIVFRDWPLRDLGEWSDLRPDRVRRDPRGGVAFFQGHGFVRLRLARAGISRAQWDALPRARRLAVIDAVTAICHAESAITSLIRHRFSGVTLKAQNFIEKFVDISKEEFHGERGFRHEIHRAAAFGMAKRLVADLLPPLKRVRDEGGRRRANTFQSEAWRKRSLESVNREAAGRVDWPCIQGDIEMLGSATALKVARGIAGRVHGLSPDLLRWGSLRSRAGEKRRPRAAPKKTTEKG